jgi:hypothetical protein
VGKPSHKECIDEENRTAEKQFFCTAVLNLKVNNSSILFKILAEANNYPMRKDKH